MLAVPTYVEPPPFPDAEAAGVALLLPPFDALECKQPVAPSLLRDCGGEAYFGLPAACGHRCCDEEVSGAHGGQANAALFLVHGRCSESDVEVDCEGRHCIQDLVGSEASARRMVEIHVAERGLVVVLPGLLVMVDGEDGIAKVLEAESAFVRADITLGEVGEEEMVTLSREEFRTVIVSECDYDLFLLPRRGLTVEGAVLDVAVLRVGMPAGFPR